MASQRSTALLQILLMLLGLILFCSGLDCETWEAQRFRDCHCGNEYKDSEVHCQDDNTYYNVVSDQRKKKCNFTCLNGGILRELGPNYYRCDCGHTNYVGTCCERETKLCGGYLVTPNGTISTPGFPRPYRNFRDCAWVIATDPGKRIALGVKGSFSVEGGSSINTCNNDWVSVHDGNTSQSKRIGPFCGNKTRPFHTIHSTSRFLYIKFHSNQAVTSGGFQLEYTTYRQGFECGPRREYMLPTAIITSPQYPLHYTHNERCEYEIFVKEGHQVILTTLHMNILRSSADCNEGSVIDVQKRIGDSENYKMLTKLCGTENYAPYVIRNATQVLLRFSSDYKDGGQFKIRYHQIPN